MPDLLSYLRDGSPDIPALRLPSLTEELRRPGSFPRTTRRQQWREYWWVCFRCIVEREKTRPDDASLQYAIEALHQGDMAPAAEASQKAYRHMRERERTLARVRLVAETVCELLVRLHFIIGKSSPGCYPALVGCGQADGDDVLPVHLEIANFVTSSHLKGRDFEGTVLVTADEENKYETFGWWSQRFAKGGRSRYTFNPKFRGSPSYEDNAELSFFAFPSFYAYRSASLAALSVLNSGSVSELINGYELVSGDNLADVISDMRNHPGRGFKNFEEMCKTQIAYFRDNADMLRTTELPVNAALSLSYGMSMYNTAEIENLFTDVTSPVLREAFGLFWLVLLKLPGSKDEQLAVAQTLTSELSASASWFEYPALQLLANETVQQLHQERAELQRAQRMLLHLQAPVERVITELANARRHIVSVSEALEDPKRWLFAFAPELRGMFDDAVDLPGGRKLRANHGGFYRTPEDYQWWFAAMFAKARGESIGAYRSSSAAFHDFLEQYVDDLAVEREDTHGSLFARSLYFAMCPTLKMASAARESDLEVTGEHFRALFPAKFNGPHYQGLIQTLKKTTLDIHKYKPQPLTLRQLLVALPAIQCIQYEVPFVATSTFDPNAIALVDARANPFSTLAHLLELLAGLVDQAMAAGLGATLVLKAAEQDLTEEQTNADAKYRVRTWRCTCQPLKVDALMRDAHTRGLLSSWFDTAKDTRRTAMFGHEATTRYFGNFLGPLYKGLTRSFERFAPQKDDCTTERIQLRWPSSGDASYGGLVVSIDANDLEVRW